MKSYEKPKLIAFSLAGNERLCGDCANKNAQILLYNDTTGLAATLDGIGGNADGTLTRSELNNMFGMTEGCSMPTELGCKFTAGTIVAWS